VSVSAHRSGRGHGWYSRGNRFSHYHTTWNNEWGQVNAKTSNAGHVLHLARFQEKTIPTQISHADDINFDFAGVQIVMPAHRLCALMLDGT